LHLQSDRERIIEIHSSNNQVAFTPNSKERNLQILKKDQHALVDIGVKSSNDGPQRARIHCVDVQTKELFMAWIIEIEGNTQVASKQIEIYTQVGRTQPFGLLFRNPMPQYATFELVSSKPQTMEVRNRRLPMQPGAEAKIDLMFLPQYQPGHDEASLFIVGEDGNYSECYVFKIAVSA